MQWFPFKDYVSIFNLATLISNTTKHHYLQIAKCTIFVYMNSSNHISDSIYTPQIVEFTALGVEFASILERGDEKAKYVERLLHILPRLYSSILSLPNYFYNPAEDFIEEYITEQSYEQVRLRAEGILSEDDLYLTLVTQDIQYSDTPVAIHISEHLADIYQHVGNLLGVIKEENDLALPAAIGRCRLYWREYWGEALISILSPLHTILVSQAEHDDFEDEEE